MNKTEQQTVACIVCQGKGWFPTQQLGIHGERLRTIKAECPKCRGKGSVEVAAPPESDLPALVLHLRAENILLKQRLQECKDFMSSYTKNWGSDSDYEGLEL